MVQVAASQLSRRGLDGTSLKTVLDESKAPRGSVYHHFPNGKDQLVGEAVRFAGERLLGGLAALDGRSAQDVVDAFFMAWRMVLTRSDCQAGCAVAAVVVAASGPGDLYSTAAAVITDWTDALAALLVSGGIEKVRSRALATSLIAAVEGALIVARALNSTAPFDEVHASMASLVASLV